MTDDASGPPQDPKRDDYFAGSETPDSSDYLASTAAAYDLTPGAVLPAEPPRSRRNVVVAAASAVALVAAGGTVAAITFLSGSTHNAAESAPASSFAFVQVDLDPSASQKLDLYRFSKRFPQSPTSKKGNDDSVVDTLVAEMVESSDSGLDYQRDVKPWLGDSAGFAAYPDSEGKATPIGILGYKDKDKAEAALKKAMKDGGGYAFGERFVVVAVSQAIASDAVAKAKKQSLEESSSHFKDDIDALEGDPLVTMWADLEKATPLLYNQFSGLLPNFGGFSALTGGSSVGGPSRECIAELNKLSPQPGSTDPYAGLSETCRAQLFGSAPELNPVPGPAPSLDPKMIPKARVALGISVESDVLQLQARGFAAEQPKSELKGSKDAARYLRDMPAGTTVAVAAGDLRPGVRELFTAMEKTPFADQFLQGLESAEQETGLSFPDDLLTVLGDAEAVAYDHAGERVAVRTHPEKAAEAKSILDKLAALAAQTDEPFAVQPSGEDLVFANDETWAQQVAGAGGLTSSASFRRAVGDVPSAPQFLAYVDLQQLIGNSGDEALQHLASVGMRITGEGSNSSFVLRLVVR